MKTYVINWKNETIVSPLEIPEEVKNWIAPDKILKVVNAFMNDYGFEGFKTLSEIKPWRKSQENEMGMIYHTVKARNGNIQILIKEAESCWIEESPNVIV